VIALSSKNSEFFVETRKRIEIVDITDEIAKRIDEGNACLVFVAHATAAIIINEYEPNIKADYEKFFSNLARGEWMHNSIDNNAEAHLLSALISPSVVVPIKDKFAKIWPVRKLSNFRYKDKKLDLGTWQRIMLVELDGPRKRKITVKMI